MPILNLLNTLTGKFYADQGANIYKVLDRLLVGKGVVDFDASTWQPGDTGSSWIGDETKGPAFIASNAAGLFATDSGSGADEPIALAGMARNKTAGVPSQPIGVAAAVITDAGPGWAFYADTAAIAPGTQVYGMEVAAKNASGASQFPFPHKDTTTEGAYGLWAAGGGDNAYGPPSTGPSQAGVAVIANSQRWQTGVMLGQNALVDGCAMALASEASTGAHSFRWFNHLGNLVGFIKSSATTLLSSIQMTDLGILASVDNKLIYYANKIGLILQTGVLKFATLPPQAANDAAAAAAGVAVGQVYRNGTVLQIRVV